MTISIYELSMDRRRYLALIKDYEIDQLYAIFEDLDERARLMYDGPNDWAEHIYLEIVESVNGLEQDYIDGFTLYNHNEMVPLWEMLKSITKKRNKEYNDG